MAIKIDGAFFVVSLPKCGLQIFSPQSTYTQSRILSKYHLGNNLLSTEVKDIISKVAQKLSKGDA